MSSGRVQHQTWPGFNETLAKLERKYPRIRQDIEAAFAQGIEGRCDPLPGYSHKLWKYRIASRDMQRGKSGGFRLIFYMEPRKEPPMVYLLTIYAKSERADLPPDELLRLWRRFWEFVQSNKRP